MSNVKRSIILLVFIVITCLEATSQGSIIGVMGGPSLSNQKVNGFQREPFLRYHGLVYIESISEINPNSLYARLGYHVKGSAINVNQSIDIDGDIREGQSYAMEFHNASFSIGFKQRRELNNLFYHYGFGVRGDYNLKGKFGEIFKGFEGAQNKFTYGVNIDVGMEFPLGELVSVVVELGFSPDLADQLFIPSHDTGYNYSNGDPVIIPETRLTNLVFETRAGFRFWRKIIYID